jgi:hypothetical protein
MTSRQCDAWAVALWEYYRPAVASGTPVYLAADRRLVRELYLSQLHRTGDVEAAVRDFHGACFTLLNTTEARTAVRREAFQRVPDQAFSRAICLAVQQVLVVEQMLHDTRYSEHAYFPRYRELLGISDNHEHSSPLSTEVFQEIWDVLRRELMAVAGATNETVTFFAGRGRDLNRSFPLSQALFTSHDLTVIREESPAIDVGTDQRGVITALLRVREHLGVRARRLIAAAAIDDTVAGRLHAQVRSFLSSDALASLRTAPTAPQEKGRIIAYLERADTFDVDSEQDTFMVYHRSDTEQTTGAVLEDALRRRLSSAPVVFLVPDADGFREWSRNDQVDARDAVLAIGEASKADTFQARVEDSHDAVFVPVHSNLEKHFKVLLCSGGLGPRIGQVFGLREDSTPVRGIEFEGGLLADGRSRIFLAGYPPTGIRCNGRLLMGEEELLVGGLHRRVAEFLSILRDQSDGARYTIQVQQAAASCSVASRRPNAPPRPELGYAVRDREVDLVTSAIGEGQPNLRGTRFSGAAGPANARLSTLDLVMLTRRGNRLALSDARISMLLAEITPLRSHSLLAELAARQVAATRSIPVRAASCGLLQRLEPENLE